MKKNRKAVALALLSIGGILFAAVNIQALLRSEGPFLNPYSRIEERSIILFVLSVLGVLYALFIALKPSPKRIPFGLKFNKDEPAIQSDNYYQTENNLHEKGFNEQISNFHAKSPVRQGKKLHLLLFLYAAGYSVVFFLYRFDWAASAEYSIVDGAIMLCILSSLVSALGFMLKKVHLAWSLGIMVAILQLIWFPYGTLAGSFLLTQLLPEKPPRISLHFKADRWRMRRSHQPLLHTKK